MVLDDYAKTLVTVHEISPQSPGSSGKEIYQLLPTLYLDFVFQITSAYRDYTEAAQFVARRDSSDMGLSTPLLRLARPQVCTWPPS